MSLTLRTVRAELVEAPPFFLPTIAQEERAFDKLRPNGEFSAECFA